MQRALIALSLLLTSTHSLAQDGIDHYRVRPIAREDVALLAEYTDTTPEQTDAIERLTSGAISRIRELNTEFQRADRRRQRLRTPTASPSDEETQTSIRAIITQWFADCKALLDEEQSISWTRFEKQRRRLYLTGASQWDIDATFDPSLALSLVNIDEDDYPDLKAALINWEDEVDRTTQQFLAASYQMQHARDKSYEERNKAAQLASQHLLRVLQAHARGYRAIYDTAPPSGKHALAISRTMNLGYGIAARIADDDAVREILTIPNLCEASRAQIQERITLAQSEADALGVALLRTIDDRILAAATTEEVNSLYTSNPAIHEAEYQVEALAQRTADDLLLLLTPKEREAYASIPMRGQFGNDGSQSFTEWRNNQLRSRLTP